MRRVFKSLLIDKQVDGIAIARHGQIRLTVATQAIFVSQAFVIEDVTDLMWRMAVHTNGDLAWVVFPQSTLDHLAMHVFDLAVASRTSLDNVVDVNARALVRVRKDVMRGVTRCAYR